MAEWRSRGYVADSDDEEESQISIQTVVAASQKAPPNDDTRDTRPTEQGTKTSNLETEAAKDLDVGVGEEELRREAGNREETTAITGLGWQYGQNRNDVRVHNIHAPTKKHLLPWSYGDIDELQEDYYKDASAAQLEAELLQGAHGLDSQDQSGLCFRGPSSSLHSTSSSPLSEFIDCRPAAGRSANESRSSVRPVDPSLIEASAASGNAESGRITRTLRHRNPIQMHPYAIESEKYRQNLKARGVKPLRIAQMEAEAANARGEEFPNMEYQAEESQVVEKNSDLDNFGSSSSLQTQDSPTGSIGNANDIFVFGDDELPDMNVLLSTPSRKHSVNGYKRRKTTSTTFRMPPGMSREAHRSPLRRETSSLNSDDELMFDVPPSPPHSGNRTPSGLSHTTLPKVRMLPRSPKAALPTPVTSSEPRKPHTLEVSEGEQSDISFDDRARTVNSDESDSDGQSSGNEATHQLQRVQRKIRGVLPASWLKLDLKTQKKRPEDVQKHPRSLSPEKIGVQRGVARPVFKANHNKHRLPHSRNGAFLMSNDEESASEKQTFGEAGPMIGPGNDEDGTFLSRRWGEAAEDDRVDLMLPSTARSRRGPRTEKRRQTKIADFSRHPLAVPHGLTKKSHGSRPHQPRITDRFNKGHTRRSKFRPPRLSILDAPSIEGSSQLWVPHFLKIASRAVRSRQDKGRHSPSQKYLRLATREDDHDANETLRNWREGTIAPLATDETDARPDRHPLYPRSANSSLPPGQLRPPFNHSGESFPRTTSVKAPMRSTRPRKLQSSLDYLVQHQSRKAPDPMGMARLPQTSDEPKKRGQLVSLIRANNDSRPAMLETLRDDADKAHEQAVFQRDLSMIDRFENESGLPNVLRLFAQEGRRAPLSNDPRNDRDNGITNTAKTNLNTWKRKVYSNRKRRPQRVDVSASWPRPSSGLSAVDELQDTMLSQPAFDTQTREVLVGLGPYGTRYSDNFEITPLPTGTYFHGSTFVGSGAFAKFLRLEGLPDLDKARGFALMQNGEKPYRWGPWNDTVSSELGEVMSQVGRVTQSLASEENHALVRTSHDQSVFTVKSIIAYFSDHLSFLDPIDRISFAQRCKSLVSTTLLEIDDQTTLSREDDTHISKDLRQALHLEISTLGLALANQILQISRHELVPQQLQDEIRSLVEKIARKTLGLATKEGYEDFETCISNLKRSDAASYAICDQQPSIEAFVVAQHVLSQNSMDIWNLAQQEVPRKSLEGGFNVCQAEQSWKRLFTLLPFLEFDARGVLETGRRFKVPLDNWVLIKKLVSPCLGISLANPQGQPPSFNAYCRALFARCLHLVNGWGWHRCESIIGTLFDFFARNNLAHLRNEESHGSPLFLEDLAEKPSMSAEPEDRCFHILLKIIGSGINHMRQSYPEKKIRDLVWRLMPNHGRSHPKEEAVRQEHLDALRNHHDLLCTLYWASPPSCRPRLTVIRNLVHLESSHREACHINIRAWSNLVRFQLSTNEPIRSIEPFAEWQDDILLQILRQHSLARTEAEDQVRSVQYSGGLAISNQMLESTISKNQRQVEAILGDALVSLKLAIEAAQNERTAAILMSTTIIKVFEMFDAGKSQVTKIILRALDVLSAFSNKGTNFRPSKSSDNKDDSQDYGDWPAFDDQDDTPATELKDATGPALQNFQEPLRHLLSNCFGSDIVPDDSIMLRLVDVWVAVAQVLVYKGDRVWTDYLDRFGSESWNSLRETEQTRKYTAYYLATLIEKENEVCRDQEFLVLTLWIGSLVERESLLKFQHRFTEALLNAKCGSPILKNLPFWTNGSSARFHVTPAEFCDRRLSLISSVLSNMRVSLEEAVLDPSTNRAHLRLEYKDLLKHMMGTMKHNYQELGHGSNIRGAYVDFVHRVVEFLQQHTPMICPIDRFFTDNGAFPLPATDPTYVVGQLKSYALRLQDSRTPKQLAIFLQSVSERAAADCQQPYLVGQLHTAMSNTFENDVSARPTLRSFLIKAIFPAYIEMAFRKESGWILVLPYLQALKKVFGELLLDLDGTNVSSVNAVTSILTAFLNSVRAAFGTPLPSSLLQEARILKTVSACFSTITVLLPVLDYVIRLNGPAQRASRDIDFFKRFATYVSGQLQGREDPHNLEMDNSNDTMYAETRQFATHELAETLNKNWVYIPRDQQYYVTRGASRREIVVDIGLIEEEKVELYNVLRDFFDCLRAMPAFCDEEEEDRLLTLRIKKMSCLDGLVF